MSRSPTVGALRPSKPSGKHPAEKSVALYRHIVMASSRPGDVCLDACAGSFAFLDAARQCGRVGLGIEQDRRWWLRGCQRLRQTGSLRDGAGTREDDSTTATHPGLERMRDDPVCHVPCPQSGGAVSRVWRRARSAAVSLLYTTLYPASAQNLFSRNPLYQAVAAWHRRPQDVPPVAIGCGGGQFHPVTLAQDAAGQPVVSLPCCGRVFTLQPEGETPC